MGYHCYIIGNLSTNKEIRSFPNCKEFYSIPEEISFKNNSDEILDHIKDVVISCEIDLILPTGFDSIKFLSRYHFELNKFVKTMPVPSQENIDILGNKYTFYQFCLENGIPHPKSFLLEHLTQITDKELTVSFPLLTKPLALSSSIGIYKFEDPYNLLKYLNSKKKDGSNALPLILQEFIPGTDIDFNGFAMNGKICAWTIQQVIEIPINNQESLRWLQFIDNKTVYDISSKIIQKSNYSGPIHIDLRLNDRTGEIKAIEINPRFWASAFASVCDGVNFMDVGIQVAYNPSFSKMPLCSNRIWGSPRRIWLLLFKHRNKQYFKYARQHTMLQFKHYFKRELYLKIIKIRTAIGF